MKLNDCNNLLELFYFKYSSVNKNEIIEASNRYINKFRKENNNKMIRFFQEARAQNNDRPEI